MTVRMILKNENEEDRSL